MTLDPNDFGLRQVPRDICESQLPSARMHLLVKVFAGHRFSEVMGDWRPCGQILKPVWQRTCKRRCFTRAAGFGWLQAVGEAPHTMPPAIRKTAVLTKRPRVIEAYPRSTDAPISHYPTERPLGENHGRQ